MFIHILWNLQIIIDSYFYLGLVFIVYAMLFYPVIGFLTGHPYPDYPIFGIAPCPVAIFTFGMFLFTNKKFNKILLVFPMIYTFSGIVHILVEDYF
ncbi:MAG: DUF6064 family protein [Candidatus Hodarchaeales archaeon]